MNISNINGNVFRFEIYNLNFFRNFGTEISGHYTFWWHKPTNQYVFAKHGDYHNLVSFKPIHQMPHFPDAVESEFLQSLVEDAIKHAYFYDGDASCHRGPYLMDNLETNCFKREGKGTEWFKHSDDEFYDNVMKINCVFDVNYPSKDYTADKEEWDMIKKKDAVALELFGENQLTFT